jgi:hypothetical protein
MALLSKDFIVKSGLVVQGTTNPVTTSTGNTGTLQVNGGAAFAKDILIGSSATIYGPSVLQSTLNVAGNVNVNNNNFTVAAANGNVHAEGNVGIRGTFNSTGTLTVNTDKFTVDASNGNTHAEGNVGVRGTFNSTGTLSVNDKFSVEAATGNTLIDGTLSAEGNFSINTDKFTVDASNGNTTVDGTLAAEGNFSVNTNKFTVDADNGNTAVLGDFAVNTDRFTVNSSTGNTSVLGTLHSGGNFDVATDKFTVASSSGDTHVEGNMGVRGTFNSTGTLTVNTDKFTVDASNGNTDILGDLEINTNKFTVAAASGNVYAAGNMGVNGTFNSTGTLTVNDNFTVTASNGNVETDGTVKINSTGSNLSTAGDNSFYTLGGAHITKDLKVGQDVVIAGNLTVQGVQTIVDSTVTNISDPVIELGTGPNGAALVGDDGLNRGIALHYYDTVASADKQMFIGRDSTGHIIVKTDAVGNTNADVTAATYATMEIGSILGKDTTESTSTTVTNALNLLGGFSVAGDSYINADLNVTGTIFGTVKQADNLNGGALGGIPYQTGPGLTEFIPIGGADTVLTSNGTTATWASAAGTSVGRATTATNVDGPQWSVLFQKDVGLTTATGDLQYNADNDTFKVNSVTLYTNSSTNNHPSTIGNNTFAVPAGQNIELYSATAGEVTGVSQLNHDSEIYVKAAEAGASLEVVGATFLLNTLTNAVLSGSGYLAAPYVRPQNLSTSGSRVVFTDADKNLVDDGGLTFDSGTEKLTVGGSIEVSGSGGNIAMTGGDLTGVRSIDMSSYAGTLTVGSTGTVKFAQLDRYGIAFINTVDGEVETAAGLRWNATPDTLEAANIRTGGTLSIGSTGTVKLAQLTNGETFGGVPYISAVDGTVSTDQTHFSYDDVADKLSISNVAIDGTGAAADPTKPALNVSAGGAYIKTDLKVDSTNATNSGTSVAAVTVAGGAKIGKDLYVDSTATIMGGMFVDDDVTINADLYVEGTIYVKGASLDGVDQISGSTGTFADIRSTGTIFSNVITATTLTVTGTAVINNLTLESATLTDLTVTRHTNLNGLASTGTVYVNNGADNGYGSAGQGVRDNGVNTSTWSIATEGGISARKNITAGGVVSAGDLAIANTSTNDTGVVNAFYAVNNMQAVRTIRSVGGASAVTIDSWSSTLYTSAKYIVQVKDGNNIHTEELMVIQDGTNVYISEYGIITNNNELGVFGGTITSGNVVMSFTPTNASGDMVIQVVRQSILTAMEDFC